jgi:hypothetical protein
MTPDEADTKVDTVRSTSIIIIIVDGNPVVAEHC